MGENVKTTSLMTIEQMRIRTNNIFFFSFAYHQLIGNGIDQNDFSKCTRFTRGVGRQTRVVMHLAAGSIGVVADFLRGVRTPLGALVE